MNLTPEQVQQHIENLETASVEELDDLLHDLFCLAGPPTDGKNNYAPPPPRRPGPAGAPLRLPSGGSKRRGAE